MDAACRFVRATGKRAAIGELAALGRIIDRAAGTTITAEPVGIECAAAQGFTFATPVDTLQRAAAAQPV